MKSDVMPSIIQMEYGDLQDLLQEVKETVATDLHVANEKEHMFSAADLWNIQKKKRAANSRRATFWN